MYDENIYIVIQDFPRWEINCRGVIRSVKDKTPKYVCINKQGYYSVQFKKGGRIFNKKVHRLVAYAFLEPPSQKLLDWAEESFYGKVQVNHKDGVKTNNCVSNLEWCDHSHNCKHASDNHLNPAPKGTKNGRAILTEDLVHKICKFYEQGGTPKQAQEKFNISRPQSTKIRSGHAWNHVWVKYNIKVNRRNKP